MSIYQLQTFKDIQDAAIEELKIQSTDTVSINRIKRDINIAYQGQVIPKEQWWWLRGEVDATTEAVICTGTASVVSNSSSVTLSQAQTKDLKGRLFSTQGFNEIYKIVQHTSGSGSIVLDRPYRGSTTTASGYKIWKDHVALPVDAKETFDAQHDHVTEPLVGLGLQEFRKITASRPKREGRPYYYSTGALVEQEAYTSISGIPSTATRSSDRLLKTIKFADSITNLLVVGDRVEIRGAGDSLYDGRYVVASISTTDNLDDTITYVSLNDFTESSITDTGITIKKLSQRAPEEDYRKLHVYPAIFSSPTTLHVDYIKQAPTLENDDDEPLMPVEDRIVLLYGALHRAWSRQRDPEEAARNLALFNDKISEMASRHQDSLDTPILKLNKNYLRTKRKFDDFDVFDEFVYGGAAVATVSGVANRVAIYNNTGEIQSSDDISTDELAYLDDNEGLTSVTLSDATSDQVVKSVDASSYDTILMFYSAKRGSNVEQGRVMVVTDGSSTGFANDFAEVGSGVGITLKSDVSSGNMRILADITSTGTDVDFKYKLHKWQA